MGNHPKRPFASSKHEVSKLHLSMAAFVSKNFEINKQYYDFLLLREQNSLWQSVHGMTEDALVDFLINNHSLIPLNPRES
jgi:hypothetical protein